MSKITFSTHLTLLRIVLTPVISWLIFHGDWKVAFALFVAAAITDYLDGFLARKYDQETEVGKFLDPLADKILLLVTFFSLYQAQQHQFIPSWFMTILFAKEALLIGGGLFLILSRVSTISPSKVAKWVTAFEMVVISYLILVHMGWMPVFAGLDYVLKIFVFFFAVILIDYSVQAYVKIAESRS